MHTHTPWPRAGSRGPSDNTGGGLGGRGQPHGRRRPMAMAGVFFDPRHRSSSPGSALFTAVARGRRRRRARAWHAFPRARGLSHCMGAAARGRTARPLARVRVVDETGPGAPAPALRGARSQAPSPPRVQGAPATLGLPCESSYVVVALVTRAAERWSRFRTRTSIPGGARGWDWRGRSRGAPSRLSSLADLRAHRKSQPPPTLSSKSVE
jgi:hypothetical protein